LMRYLYKKYVFLYTSIIAIKNPGSKTSKPALAGFD
jgi:hypothetical protein